MTAQSTDEGGQEPPQIYTDAEAVTKELQRLAFDGSIPMWYPTEIARRAFFDDFLQVQAKIENPVSDASNPHYNSKYASLESLLAMVRPILNGHGFTLTQTFGTRSYSSHQILGTYLLHRDGAFMSSVSAVPDLSSPQSVVSYSTYMRRVQLCAILGVRGENDDDGNAVQQSQPWMQSPAQAPPQQTAAPPWAQQQSAPMPMQQPPPMQQPIQQPAAAPPPMQQPMQPAPMQQPMQPAPMQQPMQPAPMQQPAAAPPWAQQQPAPMPMQQQPPMQQPIQQQPIQQPAAAPPPAQVGPPPDGAIQGDTLTEAQNIMAGIGAIWGPGQTQSILTHVGLPDISHILHKHYAPWVENVVSFLAGEGKQMKLSGPEGGNQAFIQ